MVKRISSFFGPILIVAISIYGCAADPRETAYTELAGADKGWLALSDYQRGKRYLEVHDYGLAIASFSADVRRDPTAVNSLNGLAIAYDRIGRSDIAERYFAQALAIEPGSPVTLNNLAYLRMAKADWHSAQELLDRAKAAVSSEEPAPVFVTEVVSNNERMLEVLSALRSETKTPLPPTPVVERIGEREWLVRDLPRMTFEPLGPGAVAVSQDELEGIVEIVNSSGRSRMARHIGQFLASRGVAVDRLLNAKQFGHKQSVLFCQQDGRPAAERVAAILPVPVPVVDVGAQGSLAQLYAGRDLDGFDAQIAAGQVGVENIATR